MNHQYNVAMTLRLPKDLAEQVSEVSATCCMTKAAWVRKAIRRSLTHHEAHERPVLQQAAIREALAR